jgi:TyrR family helix-turn-helix protein
MKLQDMMDSYERRLLESAVKKYRSSRKVAEALGVSQPTVLRKMKRLNVRAPED